jgi:hypothetical protein
MTPGKCTSRMNQMERRGCQHSAAGHAVTISRPPLVYREFGQHVVFIDRFVFSPSTRNSQFACGYNTPRQLLSKLLLAIGNELNGTISSYNASSNSRLGLSASLPTHNSPNRIYPRLRFPGLLRNNPLISKPLRMGGNDTEEPPPPVHPWL